MFMNANVCLGTFVFMYLCTRFISRGTRLNDYRLWKMDSTSLIQIVEVAISPFHIHANAHEKDMNQSHRTSRYG